MILDQHKEAPLIVIVGPTASGKTSLAIGMAERHNGEIICADSRTIYRGMDIGTAKPTLEDQARVPHWGLDLVEPGERFTVADFKNYAVSKIAEIRSRGRVPFLVGGTGLYVDAVIFDYEFNGRVDTELKARLEMMTIEALQARCNNLNISLPQNSQNKRHLVQAILHANQPPRRRQAPITNCTIVGISTDREILRSRIAHRSEQIFDDGVVDEAIMLGKKYGWDSEAMTGNIYRLVRQFTDGGLSMAELRDKFTTSDWQLAKRQLTWLRRNSYINWSSLDEASRTLDDYLANWSGE